MLTRSCKCFRSSRRLIEESCKKQDVVPGQLTLHADRGASMTSKPVALLLADLGLTKSHSRPHVSNDNPYSEAQFKTLKYRPDFPERFGGLEHARSFCHEFFTCYNTEHRYSGLGETGQLASQPVAGRPVNHSRWRDRFDKVTGTRPAGSSFLVNPPPGSGGCPRAQCVVNRSP